MSVSPTIHRFIVLHHEGIPSPHFDLMFEERPGDPKLVTFRLPAWPVAERVAIEPLPDHRRDYLIYEGPLSGDRGHVTRVAGGLMESWSLTDGRAIRTAGQSFQIRCSGSDWTLEPIPRA